MRKYYMEQGCVKRAKEQKQEKERKNDYVPGIPLSWGQLP